MDDKSNYLKTVLYKNIHTHYQALTNSIQDLPIDDKLKHSILYSIGSAILWAKDAIQTINFTESKENAAPDFEIISEDKVVNAE